MLILNFSDILLPRKFHREFPLLSVLKLCSSESSFDDGIKKTRNSVKKKVSQNMDGGSFLVKAEIWRKLCVFGKLPGLGDPSMFCLELVGKIRVCPYRLSTELNGLTRKCSREVH